MSDTPNEVVDPGTPAPQLSGIGIPVETVIAFVGNVSADVYQVAIQLANLQANLQQANKALQDILAGKNPTPATPQIGTASGVD